jgi:hypothetical protein
MDRLPIYKNIFNILTNFKNLLNEEEYFLNNTTDQLKELVQNVYNLIYDEYKKDYYEINTSNLSYNENVDLFINQMYNIHEQYSKENVKNEIEKMITSLQHAYWFLHERFE